MVYMYKGVLPLRICHHTSLNNLFDIMFDKHVFITLKEYSYSCLTSYTQICIKYTCIPSKVKWLKSSRLFMLTLTANLYSTSMILLAACVAVYMI